MKLSNKDLITKAIYEVLHASEYVDEVAKWKEKGVELPKVERIMEKYKNTPATHFFQFSDINKLGINPKSKYNTPIGIYSYPLTEDIFHDLMYNRLPFASDRKYIILFKVKSGKNIIHMDWTPNRGNLYQEAEKKLKRDPKLKKYEKLSKELFKLRNKTLPLNMTLDMDSDPDLSARDEEIERLLDDMNIMDLIESGLIKNKFFDHVTDDEKRRSLKFKIYHTIKNRLIDSIEYGLEEYISDSHEDDHHQLYANIEGRFSRMIKIGFHLYSMKDFVDFEKIEEYLQYEASRLIRTLVKHKIDRSNELINDWMEMARIQTTDGRYWNVFREAANRNPKLWTALYRGVGIDGFVDYGEGIIHSAEPTQAVFFGKDHIELIGVYNNSERKEKHKKKVYKKLYFELVELSEKDIFGTKKGKSINTVGTAVGVKNSKLHAYMIYNFLENMIPGQAVVATTDPDHNKVVAILRKDHDGTHTFDDKL